MIENSLTDRQTFIYILLFHVKKIVFVFCLQKIHHQEVNTILNKLLNVLKFSKWPP